jgi:hypothetical protein
MEIYFFSSILPFVYLSPFLVPYSFPVSFLRPTYLQFIFPHRSNIDMCSLEKSEIDWLLFIHSCLFIPKEETTLLIANIYYIENIESKYMLWYFT